MTDRILRWLLARLIDVTIALFSALGGQLVSGADVRPVVVEDRTDCIELNHFYDGETGREIFQQWIFWTGQGPERHVRAWRMVKVGEIAERHRNGWRLVWHDGETMRAVSAPEYRTTHSAFDPELANREVWPTELRWHLYESLRTGKPVQVTP